MSPHDPHSTSALLAESSWLHRLALRLVAEPSGAADAAQEALVKALERPPAASVPPRRWLATVLRNVVRQERRAGARRASREHAHDDGRDRCGEPASDLAARLELHARLLDAVRAMREPLRATVALRFLEDLPVHEVARRLGIPEKTVYSRLERALEELRADLDRSHGGRQAWAGLLVPLLAPGAPPGTPPAVVGPGLLAPFLAMSTLWKWTGACAALAALGFLAVDRMTERGPRAAHPSTPPATEKAAELALPSAPVLDPAPFVGERAPREAGPAPAAATAPPEPPAPVTREGFVRDLERRPVAGLSLALEPLRSTPTRNAAETATPLAAPSDAEGRFEYPETGAPARITAHGRGWATVVAPTLAGPPPPEPPVVWVAPERSYAGIVVDGNGAPVAGAEVAIYPARELVMSLTPGTLVGEFALAEGLTGEDGRFDFPSVGGAPGSRVSAEAPGYRTAWVTLPAASTAALVVQLENAPRAERALAGHVLLPDGRPVVGAWVSTGADAVRSDADGAFELVLAESDHPARVTAVLTGHLPAELELQGFPESRWRELELVLGGEALAIRGRVVDASGNAIAGAKVWTDDGVPFGGIQRELGEVTFNLTSDVESLLVESDDLRGGRQSRADAEGRFALTGLLPRRYAVLALDPRTGAMAGPFELEAGSDSVELLLPAESTSRVAGRVRSFSGEPIAGAGVNVARRRGGPGGREVRSDPGSSVRTDAEGRFVFEALCTEGTRLIVSSPDAPVEVPFELAGESDLEHLDLAFPATCHVRLRLDDADRAESLSFADDAGDPLDLAFQIGGVLCSCRTVLINGGVSDLLTTDERARTLVFWKDGKESERIPLRLVPGEVNELRY